MQTNELQADAKIRAALDYFMELIQRMNKCLLSSHRLVSLEAYIFAYKVDILGCFDEPNREPKQIELLSLSIFTYTRLSFL